MIHFSMAFLTGVLIQLSLPVLLNWMLLLLLLLIPFIQYRYKQQHWLITLALLLGLINVAFVGDKLINNLLPKALENKVIVITGEVVSPPIEDERKIKFDFIMQHIEGYGAVNAKLKLNWYKRGQSIPSIAPGEQYQLLVKLKRPNGFHNKNSFDYQTWLFINHYAATGYVKKSRENRRISSTPCLLVLACLRHQIILKSDELLEKSEFKGIVQALVLGVKNAISVKQQQLMLNTGTSHLLAISGLHIGIVSLLFYAIAKWFWRRSLYLQSRLSLQHFSLSIAFIVCVFYAAMAGFSLPTQRAIYMLFALILSQFLYRHNHLWSSYFLALFLVLLSQPLSPLNAGFWLSFAAVAIIISVLNWSKNKGYSKIQMAFIIQAAIVVLLSPFILVHFHTVSFNSFFANLFAVPVASFVIIPLSFLLVVLSLIFMPLASLLLWILAQILTGYFIVLNYINVFLDAKWHSNIDVSAPLLLLIIVVAVALYKRHKILHIMFLTICICFIFYSSNKVDLVKLHVFDVGQGLSVLVQTKNKTLLYDTGPAYSKKFTAVRSIIIPYLNRNGIKTIDKLVLSHSDIDHIGDYKTLLKSINIKKVETGQPNFFNSVYKSCHSQKPWLWDGVKFEYLSVPVISKSDNDYSCVLKITSKKTILITGDIEKKQELALVKSYQKQLKSDVLIVPHHGSKTSSSNVFLNAVQPQIAISSNGYLNRFKHPAPEVVKRYKKRNIRFYSTDKDGALNVTVNDDQGVDVLSDIDDYFTQWFIVANQ